MIFRLDFHEMEIVGKGSGGGELTWMKVFQTQFFNEMGIVDQGSGDGQLTWMKMLQIQKLNDKGLLVNGLVEVN